MSDSKQIATPEAQNGFVAVTKKQDKITNQELLNLVKSLTVLDEDNEVNLTKIGKLFSKRTDRFLQQYQAVIKEISALQKWNTDIIRQKQGGSEQGTFTNNSLVLIEFFRYCDPIIAIKMTSIVEELFTKGRVSLTGEKTYTFAEVELFSQVWEFVQQKQNCKDIILQAVKKIAKDNEVEMPKAWLKFNELSGYNAKTIDIDYEQMCDINGIKYLKSSSKFERCFQGSPTKLMKVVLRAMEIVYNINFDKVVEDLFDY
ncbi:MAG: KilA-N domain-containing protein, partial [Patescibacteria group bacterium]